MRGLECELGILQNSDGSATFQQGDTKVSCGVIGPAEVRVHREMIDKATLDCILKPKVRLPGVKEKALEEIVTKTCEQAVMVNLHPRSAIQIVMQLIQDSGSMLSSLINGACMAMLHAGIPMKCMLASVCCAIDNQGTIIVDPSSSQEKESRCLLTLTFESRNFLLVSSQTTGSYTIQEYFNCLQLARNSAREVFSFQRLSMSRFLSKDIPGVNDVSTIEDLE